LVAENLVKQTNEVLKWSWLHYHFLARTNIFTKTIPILASPTMQKELAKLIDYRIHQSEEEPDGFSLKFTSSVLFCSLLAKSAIPHRMDAVMGILCRAVDDFTQYYGGRTLDYLAPQIGFLSRETLLGELLHQRLLDQWGDDLSTLPFRLFCYEDFDSFAKQYAHLLVPIHIVNEQYDKVVHIATLFEKTVSQLISSLFSDIVVALFSRMRYIDAMVKFTLRSLFSERLKSGT
jgi:hypothetical protein